MTFLIKMLKIIVKIKIYGGQLIFELKNEHLKKN